MKDAFSRFFLLFNKEELIIYNLGIASLWIPTRYGGINFQRRVQEVQFRLPNSLCACLGFCMQFVL